MNVVQSEVMKNANDEAIYNIYLYLAHKSIPEENESLQSIVLNLEAAKKNKDPSNGMTGT